MYSITFNGKTEREAGLIVRERPSVPAPIFDSDVYDIPGRDGDLYEFPGTVSDILISVELGYVVSVKEWQVQWRKARQWLLDRGDMKLRLSDDPQFYYKVKKVTLTDSEREYRTFGEFTAEFICEGYQYDVNGDETVSIEEASFNVFNATCHPDYLISGNGDCTLTVNGKTLEAFVTENLTVNTDLMLSYRIDGTMQNTAITGDYEDLYLNPGDNTISITDGFTLQVVPHWRCI